MEPKNIKHLWLQEYTDDTSVTDELLVYTRNKFINKKTTHPTRITNDKSINLWNTYIEQSKINGVFETLKSSLVQLQFPIQQGISRSEEYRKATLRGIATTSMKSATGIVLNQPESLELLIHDSIAGKVPVLIVPNENDFRTIIRAFAHKNEPVNIPDSMGAALINGINNWDRIHRLKKIWIEENPFSSWSLEFKNNVIPNPSLYRDSIIILSKKPYSNIAADKLHISTEKWIKYSLQIRLEHECTHLFTLKRFGVMGNNMHDELIADYIGIRSVLGRLNSDWLLNFIGLEEFPDYRIGGRLENYLGNISLSSEAFNLLTIILKNAIDNLKKFDDSIGDLQASENVEHHLITTLCSIDLINMASPKGFEKLLAQYKKRLPISISN